MADFKSEITPNTFAASTASRTTSQSEPPTSIFFICGNPGLIGYYHAFLSLLSAELSSRFIHGLSESGCSNTHIFNIYGASFAGFEIDSFETGDGDTNMEARGDPAKLYGLEQQIDFVQSKLSAFMYTNGSSNSVAPNERKRLKRPRVILVGHSVGGYISMEILRRHREKTLGSEFDIIGAVLLFPAVMDIAVSPAGRRLTLLLYFIPQLALLVSLIVKFLTIVFPDALLRFLIRLVTRLPAGDNTDTTLAFLKSKSGVRQALYMATDEMRDISTDKWSDDIWGIPCGDVKTPKLVFYFGRNDHWVAERTRDEIIAMRGKCGGPKMVVCEDGLPHGFSIRHSDIMARKVAGFIEDILVG